MGAPTVDFSVELREQFHVFLMQHIYQNLCCLFFICTGRSNTIVLKLERADCWAHPWQIFFSIYKSLGSADAADLGTHFENHSPNTSQVPMMHRCFICISFKKIFFNNKKIKNLSKLYLHPTWLKLMTLRSKITCFSDRASQTPLYVSYFSFTVLLVFITV